MKHIRLILILALLFGATCAHAAFIDGMEDIPLPDGMHQITQDDISFGNEETRLLEAYLTSQKLNFKKISAFYEESLPQLGWNYQGNRGNNLLFYREGETLEIVRESATPLVVRITQKTKP